MCLTYIQFYIHMVLKPARPCRLLTGHVTRFEEASTSGKSPPRGRRKRAERQRPAFEASSGNVYLDLGFSPPEAEYLALRSRLMLMLERLIADRQLTQVDAARVLGVSQPRVSDVVRGRVERFTIDALVEMLARAGVRLDIVALPASA